MGRQIDPMSTTKTTTGNRRGVLVPVPTTRTAPTEQQASAQKALPQKADDPKARARAAMKERTHAKNAMVVSMGALVLTGYLAARGGRRDTGTARVAHMIAGVALLGTSYWHQTLYGRGR